MKRNFPQGKLTKKPRWCQILFIFTPTWGDDPNLTCAYLFKWGDKKPPTIEKMMVKINEFCVIFQQLVPEKVGFTGFTAVLRAPTAVDPDRIPGIACDGVLKAPNIKCWQCLGFSRWKRRRGGGRES